MEPTVFTKMHESGCTTRVLSNCEGVDAESGRRYHSWITERTIPLDDFMREKIVHYNREKIVDKKQCFLAAFHAIVRAANHGLYLSDCRFFNFGVLLTESATEHLVVIIDAGSSGIYPQPQLKTSKINTHRQMRVHEWKAFFKSSIW